MRVTLTSALHFSNALLNSKLILVTISCDGVALCTFRVSPSKHHATARHFMRPAILFTRLATNMAVGAISFFYGRSVNNYCNKWLESAFLGFLN